MVPIGMGAGTFRVSVDLENIEDVKQDPAGILVACPQRGTSQTGNP